MPHPKFTGRAAVLAIVLCAIALTLAYPVRQYIADRRQLDQLAAANSRLAIQVRQEQAEAQALRSPTVIEQEARDGLHWCFPSQTCYEVIFPAAHHGPRAAGAAITPWYGRLWESVRASDGTPHR
jgi:cell division protein FtsL